MVYKIVTKTLVNRLKRVLDKVISASQSGFVPGRLNTDNVVLAFELMHVLRKKNNGRKWWLSLKLDISKAYHRVEWIFLRRMMGRMGFSSRWISLVMTCISTTRFSFLINGELVGDVRAFRGLRQGCPLSPYPFLLCAEGLSALIRRAECDGELTGFSSSRYGPK